MHSAVQTANVTIIRYKPLSDLNFARYMQHYGSYVHALFSFGVYKPLMLHITYYGPLYIYDISMVIYLQWSHYDNYSKRVCLM